jgi:hypothetical protein
MVPACHDSSLRREVLLQARQIERKLIRSEMNFWGGFEFIWGNPAVGLCSNCIVSKSPGRAGKELIFRNSVLTPRVLE